jgi:Putative Actinobacterial Holin-X, holin superfamily III
MVDQASVRTNGAASARMTVNRISGESPEPAAPTAVVTSVAEFGENLFTLTELQAKLAAIELRQNVEATRVAGSVIVGGVVLALASLPVALLGIAELFVSELGAKRGFALLGVAAAGIIIGALAIAGVVVTLRRKPLGFPLSAEEFSRNVNWIRSVVTHSGRMRRR